MEVNGVTQVIPQAAQGMQSVTKEEFYKPIYDGNLDVHPSHSHMEAGNMEKMVAVWRYRNGKTFGVTCNVLNQYGGTYYGEGVKKLYFLPQN